MLTDAANVRVASELKIVASVVPAWIEQSLEVTSSPTKRRAKSGSARNPSKRRKMIWKKKSRRVFQVWSLKRFPPLKVLKLIFKRQLIAQGH